MPPGAGQGRAALRPPTGQARVEPTGMSVLSGLEAVVLDRKRPMAVQVYEFLRKMIVTLELKPGETISKAAIAAALGVSQTPVREAILRMEEEGLVDVVPQSRTSVSLLDLRQARELQLMRVALEAELAALLAKDVSDAQLAELSGHLEAQGQALDRDDFEGFAQADAAFHEAQYRFCGVDGLWGLVLARRGHMERLRRLYLPISDKERLTLNEHEAMLDAIRAGDGERAGKAVRHHLSRTFQFTAEIMERHPDYFVPGAQKWLEIAQRFPD